MIDHCSYTHNLSNCEIICIFHLQQVPVLCKGITYSKSDQLPDGLIAQLVKHCTGITEVMGSNLVQA